MSCFLKYVPETSIRIPCNRDQNGITVYEIAVSVGPISWTVQHRYREFVELNEKLVTEHSIAKDLLPPKKVLGNKSAVFLEQRQKQLELYLQKVLTFLQLAMCREFVEFLDFNRYDIIYLLQDMAQKFFIESVTASSSAVNQTNGGQHEFTSLELYAISTRLKMPCPATESSRKCFDFSHVLDYCSQLREITVKQQHGKTNENGANDNSKTVGSSNIDPGALQFDFTAFRSLERLVLDGVNPENITETGTIRETLTHLTVHHTQMTQINQMLLCDCIHKTFDGSDPNKIWTTLTHLDMSDNRIHSIDGCIALVPKLQSLRLDNNRISSIAYLNQLPRLSQLDLCENQIAECVDCHLELGNIRSLNMSQNRLRSLSGFRKMYSLVLLNVAGNQVSDVDEVDHISALPCLEELVLTANPVATVVDYRAKVISRFGERGAELYLDNEQADAVESDMALVLAALRQCKMDPLAAGGNAFIAR